MIKVDRKNPVLKLLRPLDTLKSMCLGKSMTWLFLKKTMMTFKILHY